MEFNANSERDNLSIHKKNSQLINYKEDFNIKALHSSNEIELETLVKEYSEEVISLINTAYEKPESWTDKLQVMDITRIDLDGFKQVISDPKKLFFIIQNKLSNKIVGCIEAFFDLNFPEFEVFEIPHFSISLFAVHPKYQSKGVGKYLLQFSEKVMKIILNFQRGFEENLKLHFNELESSYDFNFDIYRNVLQVFKPPLLEKVEMIYIRVIYSKTNLYDFYIKYGFKDTGLRVDLESVLPDIPLFVKSEFALLNKTII